jgi:hypothetical protein
MSGLLLCLFSINQNRGRDMINETLFLRMLKGRYSKDDAVRDTGARRALYFSLST